MISPVSGLKAPPGGELSLEEPSPSTLSSFFASVSGSILEWGISPFGGELELSPECGFECTDDSEEFDVEGGEALIAS